MSLHHLARYERFHLTTGAFDYPGAGLIPALLRVAAVEA